MTCTFSRISNLSKSERNDIVKYTLAYEAIALLISTLSARAFKISVKGSCRIGAVIPIVTIFSHTLSHKITPNKEMKTRIVTYSLMAISMFSVERFLSIQKYNWAFKNTPYYAFWTNNLACILIGNTIATKKFLRQP